MMDFSSSPPAGLAAQAAELSATVQRHGAHRWQVPKLRGAQKGLEAVER